MAAKDSRTQSVAQSGGARSRAPIAIALIVIALLVTSYWMYVRHQTAYFANRDLRLLAWSSGQLKKSLERTNGYVRSFAQWKLYTGDDWQSYRPGHDPDHEEIAKRYFPGFDRLQILDPATVTKPMDHLGFTEELKVQNGKQIVKITSVDLADWPKGNRDALAGAEGEIPLEKIAEPVFQAGFLDVFDELMLVKPGGEVIYKTHPADSERQSASKQPAADASIYRRDVYKGASKLMLTDLRQLETKTLFHDPQQFTIDSLDAETHYADVTIGGEDYIFFSQPCKLFGQQEESADGKTPQAPEPTGGKAEATAAASTNVPKKDATAAGKTPTVSGVWIVCGLVSRSHFRGDSLAISSTTVALAIALLLIAVCCWPFLRIALLGEFERLTIADALAVGVGALLGLSIATLMIVDTISYHRMESVTDAQLREFSSWFEGWLRADIKRASNALGVLATAASPEPGSVGELETQLRSPNIPAAGTANSIATQLRLPTPQNGKPNFDYIRLFPYIESLAWIDDQGTQRAKQSVGPRSPLVPVADRHYFLEARDNNMTSFRCGQERTEPIVLESIHSSTTGKAEAIFSTNVSARKDGYAVLAMTASLIQAINPVLPPGFGFVIIDDVGNVVFHDDPQRNGNENFFDESDHNRQLRAAVLARRADEHVDMKYWGEDHRAYVRPMEGLPWTLIVYRNKRLLETMNVESLVFTLFFLLLFASLLVVAIIVCALVRPRYRAPWAWPSQKKLERYRRLLVIFTIVAAVFALCIITLHERWIVVICLVLPLIAMLAAYLVLMRGRVTRMTLTLAAAGLSLLALFFYAVAESPVDLNVRFTDPFWTKVLIDAGIMAAVALVPIPHRKRRLRPSSEVESAYIWCGVLGMLLVSVLPTLGFFKAGWWLEVEALLKSGQLTLANRLEQRASFIAHQSAREDPPVAKTYTMPHFYDSSWWLLPAATENLPAWIPEQIRDSARHPRTPLDDETTLPDIVERFLPQYSEDSVRMRDLRHNNASDNSWIWNRHGQLLFLRKTTSLDQIALKRIPKADGKTQTILIVSRFPSIMPKWLLSPIAAVKVDPTPPECPVPIPRVVDPFLSKLLRRTFYVAMTLAFVSLIFWIVQFIARSIFLLDLQAPRWLFSSAKLKPTLGDHIFLTRGSEDAETLIDVGRFSKFSFADLKKDDDIATQLIKLDAGARDVLCLGLNATPIDSAAVMRELVFLERLMDLPNRTVIIDSTVSPLLILTMASSEKVKGTRLSPRQRWENVLSRFIWLTKQQLVALNADATAQRVATASRDFAFRIRLQRKLMKLRIRALIDLFCWTGDEKPARMPLKPEWLFRETRSDAFLQTIADEVSWKKYNREETLDEIRERAESYYASLWASCSSAEKLLLHQLAKHGLVNGKNRKAIRRLIARGLVRRAPHIRVFSETFRRYVLDVSDSRNLTAMEERSAGMWTSLRVPIALVTLTIAGIFFASQKDLLNVTTGVVTGLAAGLPALAKLVGLITERRLDAG